MVKVLPFEEPIVQLKNKIEEIKEYTATAEVDMSIEIEKLEERLRKLELDIYENMEPWDRVQVARHPGRPTTRDYIQRLFTNFIELHGDRSYGDDAAIIAGIALLNGNQLL